MKLEGGAGPALNGVSWEQRFGGAKLLTVWGEIKGPMAEYAGKSFTTQQSLEIATATTEWARRRDKATCWYPGPFRHPSGEVASGFQGCRNTFSGFV